MNIEDIYNNLHCVKVIKKPKEVHYSLFYGSREEPESIKWAAIYHKEFKKYIVTNDLDLNGLNGSANNLLLVGFADSLDYIMFVVYEHQVSMGVFKTIQDEIRERFPTPKISPNDKEWGWAKALVGNIFCDENGKVIGAWKFSNSNQS